jgi:hypothetical protein
MTVTHFRRSAFLLLPLLGLLPGGAAAAPGTGGPLGDLDFALHSVGRDPGASAKARTLDRSVLTTETVTVESGYKIKDLLQARSIDPDGEALSAVYVLNPEVEDVDALAPGTRLVLPAVPREKADPGSRVQLVLLPDTKRDLQATARAIDGLAAERKEISEALSSIRGYLEDLNVHIEDKDVPLSPEMLLQSLDGARFVREILEKSPDGSLSAEDRQALVRVSQDVALKAGNLNEIKGPGKSPRRWRDVQVVVSVVQLPGQKPVSDLRVFYAPAALVGQASAARPFPGFSPQVAKRLIEADYVFWAVPPGGTRPVTEQLPQQVRRKAGDEIQIQIAVQAAAQGGR